jgi:hypothetical protein
MITEILSLLLPAIGTGIGIPIGNALYKKYVDRHIHRLPSKTKEEANSEGIKNITIEDLKDFIKKLEEKN